MPKSSLVSEKISAKNTTVAIRFPQHPIAQELLKNIDFPLAAPSANPFGSISPTTAKHVEKYFKNQLEVILDGGMAAKGIESTIVGFNKKEVIVYRLGSISIEMLESVVGKVKIRKK